MPLIRKSRRAAPRLVPELDDRPLGRLRGQLLEGPTFPSLVDTQVELVARHVKEVDGDWDRLMHRLSVLAEEGPAQRLARSWVLRHPNSADARIFRAQAEYVRLRDQLGSDEQAASALDDCAHAAALRPDDPTPWAVRLGLCRVLRRPEAEFFAVWREIQARARWHREAHLQMLAHLTAADNSAHWRVEDFLDHCRAAMPANAPIAALELGAMIRWRTETANSVNGLLEDRWWAQPRRAELLTRAAQQWPQPGFLHHAAALADLNALGYALMQAKRLYEAAFVFQRLGPVATVWPWAIDGDPLERFTEAQRQALRFLP